MKCLIRDGKSLNICGRSFVTQSTQGQQKPLPCDDPSLYTHFELLEAVLNACGIQHDRVELLKENKIIAIMFSSSTWCRKWALSLKWRKDTIMCTFEMPIGNGTNARDGCNMNALALKAAPAKLST
jgi:hypothetical protein